MASIRRTQTALQVSFRDERIPRINVQLVRLGGSYTKEVPVTLPNGEELCISAEVFDPDSGRPDVSVDTRNKADTAWCSVRCTSGLLVSYVSPGGCEVLLQVGTGPWD